MTAPNITPLPTPPSRSQSPDTFSTDADAFLGALPDFATEANAQADYLDTLAATVDGDAVAAAASAAAALVSENNAEAAAAAAAGTADVELWVSGTTYAIGDNVFSPINFQTYRRKTSGAGTTDPSLDGANWEVLTFYAATPLSVAGNSTAGSELRLPEDTDNGSNYVALKAPNAISANLTLTLPSVDGAAGAALTTNGAGELTFTEIASAPTYTATATGSIANGAPCVINANGTVSQIAYTAGSTGSASTFNAANTEYVRTVYDPVNSRFITAYRDNGNSGFGTVVVASVSGTTLTYGSEIVFNAADTIYIDMIYDSVSGKVIISYSDVGNSSRGTSIVGTVSGLSITFGSEIVFSSVDTQYISMTYHTQEQKLVIAYRNNSTTFGEIIAGTISGSSITFGTALVFFASAVTWVNVIYTSALQYVIVAFSDVTGVTGKSRASTLSGTTFTFYALTATFNSAATGAKFMAYDDLNNRIALIYDDGTTLNLVFGTPYTDATYGPHIGFTAEYALAGTGAFHSIVWNPTNKAYVYSYNSSGGSARNYAYEFKYSSTGPIAGPGIEVAPISNAGQSWLAINSTSNLVFAAWRNSTTLGRGICWKLADYNLFDNNYIGISDAVYTNGQAATIQVNGAIDDAQTSLVPGEKYFVNYTGAISRVTNGTTFYPASYMGLAVATTKMIVKG